jgi:hypothetical protein
LPVPGGRGEPANPKSAKLNVTGKRQLRQ